MLSFGTGSTRICKTLTTPRVSFSDRLGFLSRLWGHFADSFDGDEAWKRVWNGLSKEDRGRYFRQNIQLPDIEPAMDDVNAMDRLSALVDGQSEAESQRHNILVALLTSSFFLELDQYPQKVGETLLCKGDIRCRGNAHYVVRTLKRICATDLEFFRGTKSLGCFLSTKDICFSCGMYRKPVQFGVQSMNDTVNLCLGWGATEMLPLSAMPCPVRWFTDARAFPRISLPMKPRRFHCDQCQPPILRPEQGRKRGKKRKLDWQSNVI